MMLFEVKNRFTGNIQFTAEIEVAEDASVGADLTGADLTRAVLRQFKADLWMTLTQNRAEVPALISALRDGKVNGSTYSGVCSCLIGTIANARGVAVEDIERDASNPAEIWFSPIRPGDTPDKETAGGSHAKIALEWAEEWCALSGVTL